MVLNIFSIAPIFMENADIIAVENGIPDYTVLCTKREKAKKYDLRKAT